MCVKCKRKYNAVPRKREWGIAEYKCPRCDNEFRSVTVLLVKNRDRAHIKSPTKEPGTNPFHGNQIKKGVVPNHFHNVVSNLRTFAGAGGRWRFCTARVLSAEPRASRRVCCRPQSSRIKGDATGTSAWRPTATTLDSARYGECSVVPATQGGKYVPGSVLSVMPCRFASLQVTPEQIFVGSRDVCNRISLNKRNFFFLPSKLLCLKEKQVALSGSIHPPPTIKPPPLKRTKTQLPCNIAWHSTCGASDNHRKN